MRLDDRVDHQLAGEPDDVDVLLVLGALRGDEGGPLGLVGDRGDLVGVDGVDRGLGPHHRDLRGGQCDRGVRLEAGPAIA